jgi:ATP-dependent Clp protease protease subunit
LTTCYVNSPDEKSPRRTSRRADPERVHATIETGVDVAGRTVYLLGAITDESAARAMVAVQALDHSDGPIRLVLSSGGGDVDAGFMLYDVLRRTTNPIIVDCFGTVMSIAVLILQAASLRRASEECRVMIHSGSAGVEAVSPMSFRHIALEVERGFSRYCELLAERAGRPVAEIQKLCSTESYFSVREAIDHGLLDSVLPAENRKRGMVKSKRK